MTKHDSPPSGHDAVLAGRAAATDAWAHRVLSIVLPALDEEEAIGETLQRCLEARAHICEAGALSEVEIIVVSDGSTDRTEEIARGFSSVTVLAFDSNRGYGAAIKTGFEHARGDLVAFLDADGTCDPRFFGLLCRALREMRADIVLGSRVGPDSEMPRVRRFGNHLFAWMLGLLSKTSVGDTASGMRVIRRASLPALYPLPDGLHFTPAMSAKVMIDGRLRLVEIPMPYAERLGRSKLSVVRDGIRFFRVIAQAALCYRPSRPLLLIALLLATAALFVGHLPVSTYLVRGEIEEWMIYRVLLASLLWVAVLLTSSTAVVAESIASLAHGRESTGSGVTGFLTRLFRPRFRNLLAGGLAAAAVVVSAPGLVQYATSGHVEMHWSRAVLSSLLLSGSAVLLTTHLLLNMLGLIREERRRASDVRPPDRLRPGEERVA